MVRNPKGPDTPAKKPATATKVKRASLVDAVHEAFNLTGPDAQRDLLVKLSERIEALEQQ